MLTRTDLIREAAATGFQAEPLEKVIRLLGLLDALRGHVSAVLPLAPNEREFIGRLNEKGDIVSELLTGDKAMQTLIRDHPGLKWKAQNVKKHFGIASDEEG